MDRNDCTSPKHAMTAKERAVLAFAEGNNPQLDEAMAANRQAIRHFSNAIDMSPTFASPWRLRGDIHLRIGELDKAISDYTRAIQLAHWNEDIYRKRGIAYMQKGDMAAALSDFNESIRKDNTDAEAYAGRAQVYAHEEKFGLALKDASIAIRLQPEDGTYYILRGNIYAQIGNKQEADIDFRTASELTEEKEDS